jgi:hypothetical protein
MKLIAAFAAIALIATVVVSGLTPIAPASPGFAKKCSKLHGPLRSGDVRDV